MVCWQSSYPSRKKKISLNCFCFDGTNQQRKFWPSFRWHLLFVVGLELSFVQVIPLVCVQSLCNFVATNTQQKSHTTWHWLSVFVFWVSCVLYFWLESEVKWLLFVHHLERQLLRVSIVLLFYVFLLLYVWDVLLVSSPYLLKCVVEGLFTNKPNMVRLRLNELTCW